MPQMAPLSWLTLFMIFNTILIICLIKIWFMPPSWNTTQSVKHSTESHSNLNMTWKW